MTRNYLALALSLALLSLGPSGSAHNQTDDENTLDGTIYVGANVGSNTSDQQPAFFTFSSSHTALLNDNGTPTNEYVDFRLEYAGVLRDSAAIWLDTTGAGFDLASPSLESDVIGPVFQSQINKVARTINTWVTATDTHTVTVTF